MDIIWKTPSFLLPKTKGGVEKLWTKHNKSWVLILAMQNT